MKENDKAILLHRIAYSESSLIVTYYTYRSGVQKFIFQGGKKKATSLFPLSLSEIHYYRRPDSDLGKLTSVTPLVMLHELSSNPIKSTIVFFLVDVLRQCLQTDQSDPELFSFVESKIISLNKEEDLSLFVIRFLLEFSEHMGIEPSLETENKKYFYLQDGEFTDFERKGDLFAGVESSELIQNLLRKIDNNEASKIVKQETFEFMVVYYKLHIPRFNVQKSLEIIREILYN